MVFHHKKLNVSMEIEKDVHLCKLSAEWKILEIILLEFCSVLFCSVLLFCCVLLFSVLLRSVLLCSSYNLGTHNAHTYTRTHARNVILCWIVRRNKYLVGTLTFQLHVTAACCSDYREG
jgi:hypothetical protein